MIKKFKLFVQVLTVSLSFGPLVFGQCDDDEDYADSKKSSEPPIILRSQVTHCNSTLMELRLTIDDYGHETEWFLFDLNETILAEGNAYEGSTTYIEKVCLAKGTYKFQITDYYNDGICCAVGYGGYVVKLDRIVAFVGGDFKGGEIKTFTIRGEGIFSVEKKIGSVPKKTVTNKSGADGHQVGGNEDTVEKEISSIPNNTVTNKSGADRRHHGGENKDDFQGQDNTYKTELKLSNEEANDIASHQSIHIADQTWYEKVANSFIGLNLRHGKGSGFILEQQNDITGDGFGTIPKSVEPDGDLCTCDCKAGDGGIGCVGWGGGFFKYFSLLWVDPIDHRWTGRLEAYQDGGLDYIGSDTRLYPGGPAIYNITCTSEACAGLYSALLSQTHSDVSCSAGIADYKRGDEDSCAKYCGTSKTYYQWLLYCNADIENKTMNFSGWDN